MPQYIGTIMTLSLGGILVSGSAVMEFYFPGTLSGMHPLAYQFLDPLTGLMRTGRWIYFGFPVPSAGIIYFLITLFTLLIGDHAGGKYRGFAILLIITSSFIFSVMSAAVLGLTLWSGAIPAAGAVLCALPPLLLIISLLWCRSHMNLERISLKEIYAPVPMGDDAGSRAASSAYLLLVLFMTLSVISATHVLKLKSALPGTGPRDMGAWLGEIRASKTEKIDFPRTGLRKGSGTPRLPVKIFTDFLCSACFRFYGIERALLEKYRNDLELSFYHFPLDRGCNPGAETVYRNSCLASRAMTVAAGMGIFDEAYDLHYRNYGEYRKGYGMENAVALLSQARRIKKLTPMGDSELAAIINSRETTDALNRDIALSRRAAVEATPTLFISGKRIVGIPPAEYLEALIREEMGKK